MCITAGYGASQTPSKPPMRMNGAEMAQWKKTRFAAALEKKEAARKTGALINSARKDLEVTRMARGLMIT